MLLFYFNQLKRQLSYRPVIKLILLLLFFIISFYMIFIAATIPQKAKIIVSHLGWQVGDYQAMIDYDIPMSQKIGGYLVQFHFFENARVLDITFPHISSVLCYQIMHSSFRIPTEILINGRRVDAFSAQSCFQGFFVDMSFQMTKNFSSYPLQTECVVDSDCQQGRCYNRFCVID